MIINTTTTYENYSQSQYMEVEKYSSILDKYGPSITILSIFILLLFASMLIIFKIVNTSTKNNNENNEMIRQENLRNNEQLRLQQEALINKIIENYNEQRITPVKEPNIVDTFIKIDNSIKDVLSRISKEVNSDRLSVYVFHNGSHSSHGLPFFKTTCISEFIRKNCGINPIAAEHSSLSFTVLDNSIHEIHKNGKMQCQDIEDIKEQFPAIYNMLSKVGVKAATGVVIYDNENRILGVLIAEYVDNTKIKIEEITEKLIEETSCLSPVLEYSDFQSLVDGGKKGKDNK